MQKNKSYVDRLQSGITILENLSRGVSPEKLHEHPVSGKWSMLECLCHVTDFEIVMMDRIKRILAENNPLIISASETGYAENLFYDKRTYENEMSLFISARWQLSEIVSHLQGDDFSRTCVHHQMGKMTAEDWIKKICGHSEYHFKFMDEKRIAMGLPAVGVKEQKDYP